MKNLSLNAKILIIVAVLVTGGAIVAYLGISRMATINEYLEQITSVYVKRDQLSAAMVDTIRLNAIQNKTIILEVDPETKERLTQELDSVRQSVYDKADAYKKISSPEGKELADKFLQDFERMREIFAEERELAKEGKMAEVAAISRDREVQVRDALNKRLKDIQDLTTNDLEQANKDAREAYHVARNTVVGVSLLALVTGLLLVTFTLRAISKAIDQVISNLTDNSSNVSSASQQIASSSEELSQAVSEQAASLQETSASVEEMSSMINRNAEGAKRSREVASESSDIATKGKETVQEMIGAMGAIDSANNDIMTQITESNEKIAGIVTVIGEISNKTKVINDIVFQTKLLSFNASVEAARAGEHGKGFAVVAEEVGNLAQMSGNAAKEISTMLENSMHRVEGIVSETKTKVEHLIKEGRDKVELGSNVAKECGHVLDEIVKSVSSVTSLSGEIANASDEQARGITEISRAMSQMDQVTQQNAAVSTQAASAAESLNSQADGLRRVVHLLVATIKGGKMDDANMIEVAATKSPKTPTQGKVLSLSKKHKGKSSSGQGMDTGRKVVGGDMVPSEHDSRFEDV